MQTKTLAAQAVATVPIGSDPVGNYLKSLPKGAQILGAKAHRMAEKSAISVVYQINGSIFNMAFSWKYD